MRVERIPVILLTGGLGSGKTTLLASWLRQPQLRNAALVINEIGEVGLDDRLLLPMTQAAEGSALLANSCICCSGMAGLEEAMADLHRARLERRIPKFDAVVIETTGLAEPQPIRAAFASDPGLRERYGLRGVIATVSSTAPAALYDSRHELQAQVEGADLLVITKGDRVAGEALEALERRLRAANPRAAVVRSTLGSLSAADALALLPLGQEAAEGQVGRPLLSASPRDPRRDPHHDAGHHHEAATCFVSMPGRGSRLALMQRLQRCIACADGQLLRIKGVVMADDGQAVAVQWSLGDEEAMLAPFTGAPPTAGLTVVAARADALAGLVKLLDGAAGLW
jgi:G3E family GTPase